MSASKPTRSIASATWYLDDVPVNDPDRDSFGHSDVASNLAAMIKTNRHGRLLVGLFGPFGVGKSTVIELLKHDLAGNYRTLRLSAERHEKPGFHRSFVFSFAEALQDSKPTLKQKIEAELEALHYSASSTYLDFSMSPAARITRTVLSSFAGHTARRALKWTGIAALVFVVAFAAAALIGFDPITHVVSWILGLAATVGGAGFFSIIWSLLQESLAGPSSKIFTPGNTNRTRPRVEAADEHERVFARLVDLVEETLIIAIDDIDRMASGDVLEALNAIRSFQLTCRRNQPVFIVAVDEGVVAEAIMSSRPTLAGATDDAESAVHAYLDRLFTQRQYMPPHAQGDLKDFAHALMVKENHMGIKRFDRDLDRLLQVLIHGQVKDPRHVIRLVNAFFGDLRLADQRESRLGPRSMRSGEVTSHPLVLARLTVLKVDFPEVYRELSRNTASLSAIEGEAVGDDIGDELASLAYSYGERGLEHPRHQAARAYIARTAGAVPTVDDLLPFIYLGQDEIDRTVGSRQANEMRRLLSNGLQADFQAFLSELDKSDDEKVVGVGTLVRGIAAGLNGLELDNAIGALVASTKVMPEKLRDSIAETVAVTIRRSPNAEVDVDGLIDLISYSSIDLYRTNLLERLTRPTPDVTSAEWFASVLARRGMLALSEPQASKLTSALKEEIERLRQVGDIATFEVLAGPLSLPVNADLARAGALASLERLASSNEDISAASSIFLISMIESAVPQFALPEILSPLTKLVSANPASMASRAIVTAAAGLPLDDPQSLATFSSSFCSAVLIDGVFTDGVDEELFSRAAPLLIAAARETAAYGRGKGAERVTVPARISSLLASTIYQFSTISAFTHELLLELASHAPITLAPVIEQVVESWLKYSEFHADLMSLSLDQIGHLPDDQTSSLVAAMGTGLVSDEEKLRASAMSLLPTALRADTGGAHGTVLVTSLIASLASRKLVRPRLDAISAVISNGSLPPETEQQIIAACNTSLIPYGGEARANALSFLAEAPWSSETMLAVLSAIEPYRAELTGDDSFALLSRLNVVTPGKLPATFVPSLETTVRELLAAPESRERLRTLSALGHLSPAIDVAIAVHIGKEGSDSFSRLLTDAGDELIASMLNSLMHEIEGLTSESGQAVAKLMQAANPIDYLKAIQVQLESQVIDHELNVETRVWVEVLASLPDEHLETVAEVISNAWQGSVADVRATAYPAATIAAIPAFDRALAPHVDAALQRWIVDEQNAAASRDIASVAAMGNACASAAKSRIGRSKRGPQKPPAARAAFQAAHAAFNGVADMESLR